MIFNVIFIKVNIWKYYPKITVSIILSLGKSMPLEIIIVYYNQSVFAL